MSTTAELCNMEPSPAFKQITVLDVQWSDCPEEVEADVHKLWIDNELHNDRYIYKYKKQENSFSEHYPVLYRYLEENNIKECWIHWWW